MYGNRPHLPAVAIAQQAPGWASEERERARARGFYGWGCVSVAATEKHDPSPLLAHPHTRAGESRQIETTVAIIRSTSHLYSSV